MAEIKNPKPVRNAHELLLAMGSDLNTMAKSIINELTTAAQLFAKKKYAGDFRDVDIPKEQSGAIVAKVNKHKQPTSLAPHEYSHATYVEPFSDEEKLAVRIESRRGTEKGVWKGVGADAVRELTDHGANKI